MAGSATVPPEALAALEIVQQLFAGSLSGVYLHGSAVSGGLRSESDVDVMAVIKRPMSDPERRALTTGLLQVSGHHPARSGGPRPIELVVFQRSELGAARNPAGCEFLYGEWLRSGFEAGAVPAPQSDPGLTLILAQARQEACALLGPPLPTLVPAIGAETIREAMRAALPALMGGLAGDERNVLLTLARMWRTAAVGDFVAKDVAAEWAMLRSPAELAETLGHARDAYLGRVSDTWQARGAEARAAADQLHREIARLLRR